MELTRAQKRVILMIVDAALLYISGYIAYFFLSEYIETSNDMLFKTLSSIVVIYLLLGLITRVFSIINRYTDYKTLSKISLILLGTYLITALVELFLSITISYRFLLLSCMFSILFTINQISLENVA